MNFYKDFYIDILKRPLKDAALWISPIGTSVVITLCGHCESLDPSVQIDPPPLFGFAKNPLPHPIRKPP